MKNILKKIAAAGAFSLVAGYAGTAAAHDVFSQPIGAAVNATDLYQVTCSDDGDGPAQRLDVYLRDDTTGTSILSVQVQKGVLAKNITDPKGADGLYTPVTSLLGGNGVYNLIVDKTIAGARVFDITYHCMTSDNVHTGTSIVRWQVQ